MKNFLEFNRTRGCWDISQNIHTCINAYLRALINAYIDDRLWVKIKVSKKITGFSHSERAPIFLSLFACTMNYYSAFTHSWKVMTTAQRSLTWTLLMLHGVLSCVVFISPRIHPQLNQMTTDALIEVEFSSIQIRRGVQMRTHPPSGCVRKRKCGDMAQGW